MTVDRPAGTFRLRLWLAITLTVGVALCVIGMSAAERDGGGLFSGTVGLLLYSTLGVFALRGHAWARWTLFAFLIGSALCATGFLAADRHAPLKEMLGLALAATVYTAVAVSIALPARRPSGGANSIPSL